MRSSPKKGTSAIYEPIETMAPLFDALDMPSILRYHIKRAETTFLNEMLYIQAMANAAARNPRTDKNATGIKTAAESWISTFREGMTKFENACERKGFFDRVMVEDSEQEFSIPNSVGCGDEMLQRTRERQQRMREEERR